MGLWQAQTPKADNRNCEGGQMAVWGKLAAKERKERKGIEEHIHGSFFRVLCVLLRLNHYFIFLTSVLGQRAEGRGRTTDH
jgi:hypothetical protein